MGGRCDPSRDETEMALNAARVGGRGEVCGFEE